jgi:hypothetical protein
MAIGLAFAVLSGAVLAEQERRQDPPPPRGLDFRTYLSLERGMPDGEVFAIAGRPDLVTDQGFAPETTPVAYDLAYPAAPCGASCFVKTYTYLPTPQEPYTTTITFVGGRVYQIERDRKENRCLTPIFRIPWRGS